MAYEAMARRYRPRSFADVIGQDHVARTLQNAIRTGRVAHAYLFCGPHGCGKTSMARIFACALVCPEATDGIPCGACPLCSDILRGQDVDVQEIDGASNNGVDQVRALREQVGYIPQHARYKIYIIDEVHMLSIAAFNALLKTLEEPPPHVKFILATTDPHKVPETVHSRCQRFDFRLVPPPRLAAFFRTLAGRENAAIEEDALDAVAAFSGGSVRDGLVLLDQLLSYAQGTVTREDVERVRGVAGVESILGLYEALLNHDAVAALGHVDAVAQCGTNIGDYLDQLIEFGRDLMHVVVTGEMDGVSAYGPARATLERMGNEVPLDWVLLTLDVFTQARTRIRQRALSNPLVPLEMAVARLAGLDSIVPVGEAIRRLDAHAKGAPLPTPGTRSAAHSPSTTESPPIRPRQAEPQGRTPVPPASSSAQVPDGVPAEAGEGSKGRPGESAPAQGSAIIQTDAPVHPETNGQASAPPTHAPWEEEPSTSPANPASPPPSPTAPTSGTTVTPTQQDVNRIQEPTGGSVTGLAPVVAPPSDRKALEEIWKGIREALRAIQKADLGFLHDVWVQTVEEGALILSVPGGGSFIFEQLEDAKRKARIADAAEQVLGRQVQVRLVMREGGDVQEAPIPDGEPRMSPDARARREAQEDPAVQLIMKTFDGDIFNIE